MAHCKHCGADLPPNKQVKDVKEILHEKYTMDYLNEIFEDIADERLSIQLRDVPDTKQ